MIPVQYRHSASPYGLILRRDGGGDLLSAKVALAALPLAPAWCWNSGLQLQASAMRFGLDPLTDWRGVLLPGGSAVEASAWQVGLAWFIPLVLVSLLMAALIETLFAAVRARRVEPGWYLPAWLFALMIPAGVSLPQAGFAIGLGVLIGRLIFGGPGKQLLSPALLGVLFLYTAYPDAMHLSLVPAGEPPAQSVLALWGAGGAVAVEAAGFSWWAVFLGREAAPYAATSALACLLAAVYLCAAGVTSWRTVAGGLLGLGLASASFSFMGDGAAALIIPGYWHAALGGFAFGLVFLAADPGSTPLTLGGRWFLGLATGALTVLIRALDPAHPDGVLHAILLAALFAPLADEWVVRRAMARRRRSEEAWP